MGTINLDIKYLTFQKKEILKDFDCVDCRTGITDKDIEDNNFILGVSDYANEITKDEEKNWLRNKPIYGVSLWLKIVEHKECPELMEEEDIMEPKEPEMPETKEVKHE
ncbi:hypothetical protein [endosymbiont GvMRE of Glomus versiforme]|uniref:hypothetical protein n=1 Tax=endosymbiont GvMRE of Glomus versiforme TaxID=2039283 RepID=UPI000EEACDA6|nr:hypothetical protein [endosymbiont GvMRE of Glomus versiforme]RHZ35782.1 hypothetical protein GvMRE_Ic5g50 [endosymbiont GvMRE of Glomus versiforme]